MATIKSSLKEKFFYAFGNMGGYILWSFVAIYVTVYLTDCLNPGEQLVTLMGTIILICRIFDAFSDILMGVVIEKTHSKVGKARFWYGVSIIPLTVIFFFLFFLSGLDKVQAIVWLSILYFLFTVVFYTMNNIAFNAMLPLISNDPYDQSNICTIDSVFTALGTLICSVAVMVLKFFGGENLQSSWTYFVLIIIGLALIGQALCFFKVKEKKRLFLRIRFISRRKNCIRVSAVFLRLNISTLLF
jgi:glycoside/pentoside/hexuronide:cation symporter, GPH family